MSLFYSAGLGGSAIPDSQTLGFEDGDLSNWNTVSEFQVVSDRVFADSFAGFIDYSGDTVVASALPFDGTAVELSQFSYAFNEDGSATGHAVIIYNDNGDEILRFGSSSIDATVVGANGSTQVSSGWADTDEWISFDCIFDWGAGTADVTASDGSNSDTVPVDLMNAGGVSEVRIHPAGAPNRLGNYTLYNWFDEFEFLT